MRSFRLINGFTTLRVIAQQTAIEMSINTAITADAALIIDQNDASISDMYSALPIIRCQGSKPRAKATLSNGVGSVLLLMKTYRRLPSPARAISISRAP